MPVIAIDGPAGSGKSTVARGVAERLGLDYLDTGAMYRSVAWACLRDGVPPGAGDAVAALARALEIDVAEVITVDGENVTEAIRTPEVTLAVTAVAATPAVRYEMVRRQRAWATDRGGGVIEGRDIGSVVFPDAEVKVYLTADEGERARRRSVEGGEALAADIARRDAADSTRAASPLQVADGAVVIDTTGSTVDEVVDRIVMLLPRTQ